MSVYITKKRCVIYELRFSGAIEMILDPKKVIDLGT